MKKCEKDEPEKQRKQSKLSFRETQEVQEYEKELAIENDHKPRFLCLWKIDFTSKLMLGRKFLQ